MIPQARWKTEDGGWGTEDGGRKTRDGRWSVIGRQSSVICPELSYNNYVNRYTGLFTPGLQASPAGLRQALEAVISAQLAAGSYRLGAVAPYDGRLAAEVACRLPREEAANLLREAGVTAGCPLEKSGWGWLLSGKATYELVDEGSGGCLFRQ